MTLKPAILFLASASLFSISVSGHAQHSEDMERRIKQAIMNRASGLPEGGNVQSPARSQPAEQTPRTGRPLVAFKGCDGPRNLGQGMADGNSTERYRQASRRDPTSSRVFAAMDITEAAADAETMENDCRFRLDGIWTQDISIGLDESKNPPGFGGIGQQAARPHLANGNYKTPVHMYVEMLEDGRALSVRPAADTNQPIILRSADHVPLGEVLRPGGQRKAYLFPGQNAPDPATSLFVDVTRSGKVRLRISGTDFYRPRPVVSEAANVSSIDAWMVGFNLDNISANRRGYDIVEQDPFRLNSNSKAEIFGAANPNDYAIVEKRTVPLGLKLVPQGEQGTITTTRIISSQREYQQTVSTSFGTNIGFPVKNSAGDAIGAASAGAGYANSQTEGMSSGSQESIAMGFARHKLYALVLDQPFAKLSDDFIDAVDDAYRFERYDDLIRKFGTHYPYAITYGSAAKMEARFSQTTVAGWEAQSKNVNAQAGLAIAGFGVSTRAGSFEASDSRNEQLESAESTEFDAVGGTGSFSEGGHGTGTPYPILADLRPIHELLNPMNFPNEPEVYNTVRPRLEQALEAYLAENSTGLSSVSNIPDVQIWELSITQLKCRDIGDEGGAPIAEIFGSISVVTANPPGTQPVATVVPFNRPRTAYWNIGCNDGVRALSSKVRISGTFDQIVNYRFRYGTDLHEADTWPDTDDVISKGGSGWFTFPVKADDQTGKRYPHIWAIPTAPGNPRIEVHANLHRIQ